MTQGDYEVREGRICEELDNIRHLEDELVQGGILPEDAEQVPRAGCKRFLGPEVSRLGNA